MISSVGAADVVAGVVAGVVGGSDVGVGGALVVGVSLVGGSVVGVCDGVSLGVSLIVGVVLGAIAAPWVVSRSNVVTPPIALKVYAAHIWAGKPPPLTRPPPAAPLRDTCVPCLITLPAVFLRSLGTSPNRPTEVTRFGVYPVNQADLLLSDVPVLPATC